jgi:hypothetical protein
MKRYLILLLAIAVLSCTNKELTIRVQIEAENQDLLDQTVTSVIARAQNIGNVLSNSIEKKSNGQFLLRLQIDPVEEVNEEWIRKILETKGIFSLARVDDFPWNDALSRYSSFLKLDSSASNSNGFFNERFTPNDRANASLGAVGLSLAKDTAKLSDLMQSPDRNKFIPPSIQFIWSKTPTEGYYERLGYYMDYAWISEYNDAGFDQRLYEEINNAKSNFLIKWQNNLIFRATRYTDIHIETSNIESLMLEIKRLSQESSGGFFDMPISLYVGPNVFELYAVENSKISSKHIISAISNFNYSGFGWNTDIQMNDEGAEKWRQMTNEATGKQIAIIVDDRVFSAPIVQQEITGGQTQISGLQEIDAKLLSYIIPNPYSAEVKVIEYDITEN